MPRGPRIQFAGETYHVTTHGIDKRPVFGDDEDRALFLALLRDEQARSKWTCLSYTILTTHYHVLLRLREETLSSGFHRLNSRYAQAFNRKYGRRGHVFERRFRDVLVESESHRYELARYIALNAPRANMATSPQAYPFCDYGSTIGLHDPDPIVEPKEALGLFGRDVREAQRRFRAFVEERDPRVRRGQTRA